MANKDISITINSQSVSALNRSGAKLIICKSVGNSDQATFPLLWSVLSPISESMHVSYKSEMQAYTSTAVTIQPGQVVEQNSSALIAPGQIFVVDQNAGGGGQIKNGGQPPSAVNFQNATGVQYTCGLMQAQGSGNLVPYCFAPLFGAGDQETFFPLDKILLGFCTGKAVEGMYLTNLVGLVAPAALHMDRAVARVTKTVLVDLTSSDKRAISFDVNAGWSWGEETWAQTYPATTPLAAILIEGDQQ